GRRHRLGVPAALLPRPQDRPAPPEALAGTRPLPGRLGQPGRALPKAARHQLGPGPAGRLQEAVQKGGEATGPSPVDRAKCGTALHLACDARAMPLGVVVTGANANDGVQTRDVLEALVVRPPGPERPVPVADVRDLPGAIGDGGYGNGPSRERARAAGF